MFQLSDCVITSIYGSFCNTVYYNSAYYITTLFGESKKISNDQELIQSDPIPCLQNQMETNEIHKLTAVYERHGMNSSFPNRWSFSYMNFTPQGFPGVDRNTLFLSSPHLCFIIVFTCDLFVSHNDTLMS